MDIIISAVLWEGYVKGDADYCAVAVDMFCQISLFFLGSSGNY